MRPNRLAIVTSAEIATDQARKGIETRLLIVASVVYRQREFVEVPAASTPSNGSDRLSRPADHPIGAAVAVAAFAATARAALVAASYRGPCPGRDEARLRQPSWPLPSGPCLAGHPLRDREPVHQV